MFKRILYTVLIVLIVYSSVVVGYVVYEPEYVEEMNSSFTKNPIDYGTLAGYTLSGASNEYHYYFFCTSESNDCIYMANTVLKDSENQAGISLSSILEYVDVTDYQDSASLADMQENWNISAYPALVAVHVHDGEIDIENKLEWDATAPLSTSNVLAWLEVNDLIEE